MQFKKCKDCKYAYNSKYTTIVQCKVKNFLAKYTKDACTSTEHWDTCDKWHERPTYMKPPEWDKPYQMSLSF